MNITPKTVPVSTFVAVSIIVVFLLYTTSVLKSVPCGKDVLSQFKSNFVHTNGSHLFANLFSLYTLSRVEVRIGSKAFFTLVSILLVTNTMIETVLHKIKPDMKCSIGFSGVLFGILVWEMISRSKLDLYLLAAISLQVVAPSMGDSKISFVGHAVGAVSGLVIGAVWAKIAPEH
jgi:membrane associated rhomboid family serine protease